MERAVKRLDLNFDPHDVAVHHRSYSFCGLSISNSITSLKLSSVNVTGEGLQNFLKVCLSLEYLSVRRSAALVNLDVSGATLNLKYLEIYKCHEVKHIEICAPNLVSVKYSGRIISTPFKSTPKLATLLIGGTYSEYLTNKFLELPSCLFQLEKLGMEIPFGIKLGMKYLDPFPLCKRLKQLELIVYPFHDEEDLLCFAPLIKACPFLHKFVLKLRWDDPDKKQKRIKVEPFRHEHLKIVEIVGFLGNAMDIEFVMYLVASCVALEKVIIDLHLPVDDGTPWEFEMTNAKRRARKQAEKIRTKIEPGVELIIL